jgi:hypothetical protein
MKWQRWSPTSLLIVLAIAVGLAAAACGGAHPVDHSLSYSVVPYTGGLTATVADNRIGKHTVWVVLLNPPQGVPREWFAGESAGNSGVGWSSGSTRGPLLAGTYKYAIYSADGIIRSAKTKYWTREHLVAEGQVTVP